MVLINRKTGEKAPTSRQDRLMKLCEGWELGDIAKALGQYERKKASMRVYGRRRALRKTLGVDKA